MLSRPRGDGTNHLICIRIFHIDHGIGKFLELETVTIGKIHHDCLKIEYAGGDRLFVPVENIEVLARFGGAEDTTTLDKLGGAGWQARKAKVKKDLMAMADGLLKIAAAWVITVPASGIMAAILFFVINKIMTPDSVDTSKSAGAKIEATQ